MALALEPSQDLQLGQTDRLLDRDCRRQAFECVGHRMLSR
jgi:hypothetical protein